MIGSGDAGSAAAASGGARAGAAGRGAGARSRARSSRPQSEPEPEPSRRRRSPSPSRARASRRARRSRPAAAAPSGGRDYSAYVTPLVRKMATQHGVDLAGIVGTGVGGRIRKQDVLDAAQQQGKDTTPTQPAAAAAAAAAQPTHRSRRRRQRRRALRCPSPLRGKTEPMTRLRKVIAQRMVESLQRQRPADHGGRGRRHRDLAAARLGRRPTSRRARA